MPSLSQSLQRICAWDNLLLAYNKAAKGKRSKACVAAFDYDLTNELLELQKQLLSGIYQPGNYVHFYVHEPKRRKISAAPFRDRVVHHAICNIIEPRFEALFIADNYANRKNKGTHKAVDCLQSFSRRFRYVLRADIVKHFPSIDHAILKKILRSNIDDDDVMQLINRIIDSGNGVLDSEYSMQYFPGDDLFAACRPRGLPIGNLTSQLWSNCYLNSFDHFVKRELGCNAYLRYVDDFALFSNSKKQLWMWKQAIIGRLQQFRLVIHESTTQVLPVRCGIPWLGFVVYPSHRKLKARKVRFASQHLSQRLYARQSGQISRAELEMSIKGWVNHVSYADTWGLRLFVLNRLTQPLWTKCA